jgi:hypothetical protein
MAPKNQDHAAAGCLMLFALPFAAAGAAVFVWACSTLVAWQHMRSWVEVPAQIERAELQAHDGGDATTDKAVATYRYEYAGRSYTGNLRDLRYRGQHRRLPPGSVLPSARGPIARQAGDSLRGPRQPGASHAEP